MISSKKPVLIFQNHALASARCPPPIAIEGSVILAAMSITELEVVKGFFDKALALHQHHTDRIRPRGTQDTRQHEI
jgi:hypothetical protein